jgi:uncharacterized membrane protein
MMTLFDYMFYRLAKFYYRWDRSSAITAIIGLSFVQACALGCGEMFLIRSAYSRSETAPHSKAYEAVGVVTLVALILLNGWRYHNRYVPLRERWQGEAPVLRVLKGSGVLLLLVLPLAGMLYWGVQP